MHETVARKKGKKSTAAAHYSYCATTRARGQRNSLQYGRLRDSREEAFLAVYRLKHARDPQSDIDRWLGRLVGCKIFSRWMAIQIERYVE